MAKVVTSIRTNARGATVVRATFKLPAVVNEDDAARLDALLFRAIEVALDRFSRENDPDEDDDEDDEDSFGPQDQDLDKLELEIRHEMDREDEVEAWLDSANLMDCVTV